MTQLKKKIEQILAEGLPAPKEADVQISRWLYQRERLDGPASKRLAQMLVAQGAAKGNDPVHAVRSFLHSSVMKPFRAIQRVDANKLIMSSDTLEDLLAHCRSMARAA